MRVTIEEVKENMKDVLVRTEEEFGKKVTYVTVRMKNGFTLRESTTCVNPANYNEEIGKQICLEKIEDKVWFLLGYALQDRIASEPKDFQERLVREYTELSDRLVKLQVFMTTEKFKEFDEFDRNLMSEQSVDMSNYKLVLYQRMKRLGIDVLGLEKD